MSVSEDLVEKGAKALRDDTAYASSYARKVLEAVLPDIEAQVEAFGHTRFCGKEDESPSFPDVSCTCIMGDVLGILRGERL